MRGAELAKLVDESGLKAQVVYDRAGYARSHFYKILQKKDVSVDEFTRIATALGLKPGDLLENSAAMITPELKPLLDMVAALQPAVRRRTLRIVEQVVGIQDDVDVPTREREDNVLQFIPAKSNLPTSDAQIDTLSKAMAKLGAQPRQAKRGPDFSVPLIANLSAGKGLETFAREHEYREINSYYWNRGVRAVFRVVGNSLFDMGITDRDLLYVRPVEYSAPKSGEVVACTLNNESYAKVYEKDADGRVWLKSRAAGFEPIEVKESDDFRVWGVVVGRTGDL